MINKFNEIKFNENMTFDNSGNFNMNNQIYSPCVFEYPNSRYILSMPSTGSDKYKNCDSLLVSSNYYNYRY